MAYRQEDVAEHMIPLDPEVEKRVYGFYQDIGWEVSTSEEGLMINVAPQTGPFLVKGIGYWRTKTHYKTDWFENHEDPDDPTQLSVYTRGLRLPKLMDLIEVPLVLPTNDHVELVVDAGGDLLKQHMHQTLRTHADRLEFRFADPFLFGVRVTGPKPRTTKLPKLFR